MMQYKPSNRRSFLKKTSALAGVASVGPWLTSLAAAQHVGRQDRILVVIQLSGGNDGLNTVIPFRDDEYRRSRPKLAIPADEVLKINDDLGFHPSLDGVASLLEAGRLSIIQGVGYEAPNRSHFESMDIWHTCLRKGQRGSEGWIGRLLADATDASLGEDSPGLHLGQEQQPLALISRGVHVPSVGSIDQFRLRAFEDGIDENMARSESVQMTESRTDSSASMSPGLLEFLESSSSAAVSASERLTSILSKAKSNDVFPSTPLGEKLQIVSRLITAGINTRVYYVTLDGFDTHSLQAQAHTSLLRQWSDALNAFVQSMQHADCAERVLVMTFSEFGRRVAENASEGTDHGAAAPVFFAGPSIDVRLHGQMPSLTDLDDGDQKFHTDFRRVYATVVEKWFETSSQEILGGHFEPLDVLGNGA